MTHSSTILTQVNEINSRVRQVPTEASHRLALAQLRAAAADYARALQQIQVAAKLDPALTPTAQVMRLLIQAEHLRNAVFAGNARPEFIEGSPAWIEQLLLALQAAPDEAQMLRQQALEAAPEAAGSADGVPFAWIADGDSRLGPVFEVILSGAYHWIPATAVTRLHMAPPTQLLDLVWAPVTITLVGGTPRPAFMPTRYPVSTDPLPHEDILLGRRTEWTEHGLNTWHGHGLRTWYAGDEALPLFQAAEIVIGDADPATPISPEPLPDC